MSYNEVLGYLFDQLPMFQRIGPAAYKSNLDNTLALSRHLGQPEKKFRSIHIAGTNGKGSVASMLASAFYQQGYKTGLATSPHLKDFRERIRINTSMIPRRTVTQFVQKHKAFFEKLNPSFFEITIALTFDYFAREQVDIAIIETGLGGRLDSTNILTPELSVITNIGMDHTNLLGNTLKDIAKEKGGIIKEGVPVVIGRYQQDTIDIFRSLASSKNAPLYLAKDFMSISGNEIKSRKGKLIQEVIFQCPEGMTQVFAIELLGFYQQENLATALTAVEIINHQGSFLISDQALRKSLLKVKENTGFMGRWHQLSKHPRVIADTGHNSDGLKMINRQLASLDFKELRIVLGMVDDKDIKGALSLFPKEAIYYFCRPDIPRGLDLLVLSSIAKDEGLEGEIYPSVRKALEAAKKDAGAHDLIFVGGSTFVVAEVV